MNGRVWGRWFVLKRTDSMAYGYTSGAVSSATSDLVGGELPVRHDPQPVRRRRSITPMPDLVSILPARHERVLPSFLFHIMGGTTPPGRPSSSDRFAGSVSSDAFLPFACGSSLIVLKIRSVADKARERSSSRFFTSMRSSSDSAFVSLRPLSLSFAFAICVLPDYFLMRVFQQGAMENASWAALFQAAQEAFACQRDAPSSPRRSRM